jgi:hypothetical protein
MISDPIKNKLLQQLDALPDDLQRRVLDFAQALALTAPKGVPGKELTRFAGTISAEDLRLMEKAIESGCEGVSNEWSTPPRTAILR